MNKIIITLALSILCISPGLYAQEGMPPANVVVADVNTGMVAPESEFIGTVYYHEVSEVSCEMDGKVEEINFEEGQRVKKGDVLVKLNSDLLMSDLKKAKLNFKRAKNLFNEDFISEEIYDERRFEMERLEIELRKKHIKAPFDGVIISKHVDRGEWLSPGSVVTTMAKDDIVNIIAEVPGDIIGYIKPNMDVTIKTGGKEIQGKVITIIPRGDISTRTFPVKISANNSMALIEGMEARVVLPSGQKQETLIVPRDAVISMFGMTVVFAVIDSKAKMIQAQVAGYEGLSAGILAQGLTAGMKVVVKGNERLRDGQPVNISN